MNLIPSMSYNKCSNDFKNIVINCCRLGILLGIITVASDKEEPKNVCEFKNDFRSYLRYSTSSYVVVEVRCIFVVH